MLRIGVIGGQEVWGIANVITDVLSERLNPSGENYKMEFSGEFCVFPERGGHVLRCRNGQSQRRENNKNTRKTADMLYKNEYYDDIVIEKIDSRNIGSNDVLKNDFDVLIVNSLSGFGDSVRLEIESRDSGLVIINSDEKDIFKMIKNTGGVPSVVTYGINSRASVTVSSISESRVVCCVQRALPTFGGGVTEQQEFSVAAPGSVSGVYGALAAAAVATFLDH
jgi:hypothetical protein